MRDVISAISFILSSVVLALFVEGVGIAASADRSVETLTANQGEAELAISDGSAGAGTKAGELRHTAASLDAGGPGASDHDRQTFERVCGVCHETSLATDLRNTRGAWRRIVNRMYALGMTATNEEAEVVIEYLADTYPAQ